MINVADIETIIAKMARIPPKTVSSSDKDVLRNLDRDLKLVVFGQEEAIENLAKAFDDKAADAQVGREAEVTKLHAKIGQLVVERDFLAKAFDR